ncbi:hypothetical protein [Rothia sp. P7208]|uniref:hypothetical protein n=1 Tax=Rothia sp. P7208 TaxID=3402660 RepID=UPI003ACBB16B
MLLQELKSMCREVVDPHTRSLVREIIQCYEIEAYTAGLELLRVAILTDIMNKQLVLWRVEQSRDDKKMPYENLLYQYLSKKEEEDPNKKGKENVTDPLSNEKDLIMGKSKSVVDYPFSKSSIIDFKPTFTYPSIFSKVCESGCKNKIQKILKNIEIHLNSDDSIKCIFVKLLSDSVKILFSYNLLEEDFRKSIVKSVDGKDWPGAEVFGQELESLLNKSPDCRYCYQKDIVYYVVSSSASGSLVRHDLTNDFKSNQEQTKKNIFIRSTEIIKYLKSKGYEKMYLQEFERAVSGWINVSDPEKGCIDGYFHDEKVLDHISNIYGPSLLIEKCNKVLESTSKESKKERIRKSLDYLEQKYYNSPKEDI